MIHQEQIISLSPLTLLYNCLKSYDAYLWVYRDSDGDGCLETWCTWDTGEDNSLRFTRYGTKDGGFGGEDAPRDNGMLPFASMDIMSYSCQCREILGKISDCLENGEGDFWRAAAKEVRKKIHDYLWIDEKHTCYDRDRDHNFMDVLLLSRTGKLVQQYDSFDGTPCVTRSEGLAPAGEETERYHDTTAHATNLHKIKREIP